MKGSFINTRTLWGELNNLPANNGTIRHLYTKRVVSIKDTLNLFDDTVRNRKDDFIKSNTYVLDKPCRLFISARDCPGEI